MTNISLRQWSIFEKVVSLGSATAAGEALLISQSAVSMAIGEVERLSGGALFTRSGRRLLVNERGRALVPEIRELLNHAASLERALRESADDPAGVLVVGASTTIGNYLLPMLFGRFARRYRRAQVVLQVGNTQQISSDLLAGRLDLALIEGPCHIPELACERWRDDELVVIVAPSHPWAECRRTTASMLREAAWIMREAGSGTREVFETAMAPFGRFTVALELGHTEAIKKAVEGGLGVGCLSRLAVQRELAHRWLKEVKTPLRLKRTLFMLTRPERRHTPLYLAFLDLLKDPQVMPSTGGSTRSPRGR